MKTKENAARQKSNITLKLDRDLLREVRVLAAEKDTSISALLTVHLKEIVRSRGAYDRARNRAIAAHGVRQVRHQTSPGIWCSPMPR